MILDQRDSYVHLKNIQIFERFLFLQFLFLFVIYMSNFYDNYSVFVNNTTSFFLSITSIYVQLFFYYDILNLKLTFKGLIIVRQSFYTRCKLHTFLH